VIRRDESTGEFRDDGANDPTNEMIKIAAMKMGGEMVHVMTGRDVNYPRVNPHMWLWMPLWLGCTFQVGGKAAQAMFLVLSLVKILNDYSIFAYTSVNITCTPLHRDGSPSSVFLSIRIDKCAL